MNITVFGSADLTLSVLDFLYDNSYKIKAVVSAPEIFKISYQPEGVKNSRFVDLRSWTEQRNIPIISYDNSIHAIQELKNLGEDTNFAIVVGWYHMVPKKLRDLFSMGCSGFHASLLPKLRGGAPLNWAILSDLKETGVSFFELSDGVDDGLLYDQMAFCIEKTDAIGDLVKKSENAILQMLQRSLPKIQNGIMRRYEQQGVSSYCGQRKPEDSLIDWKDDAELILRLIKASSKPYAGAYTFLDNQKITIWNAQVSPLEILGVPGQILVIDGNAHIVCGRGALDINEAGGMELLMKANHKRLCFA
jgi:methionyl-tRNA formyltransferase